MSDTTPSVPTASEQLSAFDAFFDDPVSAAVALKEAISRNGLLDELPPEAPSLPNTAVRLFLGQVVDQILELLRSLPISDMLTEGWAQLEKIADAQAATRLDGSSRDVLVLEHQLSITQAPTIEMLIDEVPVPLLVLGLDIRFDVASCSLRVAAGEITRVEPGPIAVHSTLRSRSHTLIEHTISEIDPARLLGSGWPTERSGPG